jgi:NAD(P)-dependent dehydrogenase (short-subunit alcohol dehydrogenase family)
MRLEGKVAIVTGGSRGIGRGCVELFAAEGARVITADVSKPDTPFEAEGITYRELDVTDLESWGRVVNSILEDEGRLDILVNNAGTVGSYDPIHAISLDDWERVIELNQHAVFYGMRTVIPIMRERGGGSIINISSIWGIAGAAGVAAYQASKGAVRLMSKNAALSYVEDGIRVNSIHPGIIDTPMIEAQDAEITAAVVEATPMKRLGTPRELAYGALYLASDESSFVTGTELVIDGGYTTQ